MNPRSRQQGIAALTAILVVAIATVLAVNLLWQTSVELQRTENLLLRDQAQEFDLGGEAFAIFGLAEDYRSDGAAGIDTLVENWAKPVAFEVEAGKLQGYLQDQQGRFDLNSLVDGSGKRSTEAAEQYQRLLTLLPLENPLDSGTAAALTEATIDWIDPDQSPGPVYGAEDDRYTARTPPYRPANFWFTSTSELLAVDGYTPDIYRVLEPHITALPPLGQGRRRINVNTATDLVLASLVPNRSALDVEPFVAGGYQDAAEFLADFPGSEQIPPNTLDVRSSWFLLTVTASIGTVQSTMYSLLERNGEVVRARRRTFDAN